MKKFIITFLSIALCQFASAAEEKIEITGNDQLQYNVKNFEVTEGQKVVLSFKHIGQLPAESMGHNVVILKPGTVIPAFATKCAPAKKQATSHKMLSQPHRWWLTQNFLAVVSPRKSHSQLQPPVNTLSCAPSLVILPSCRAR